MPLKDGKQNYIPQNTQWRKFIGVDFIMEFSVFIFREIK